MSKSLRVFGVSTVAALLIVLSPAAPRGQSTQTPPSQPSPGAQGQPAPAPQGQEGQAPPAAGQGQPAPATQPQQPTFRTGINFVRVDVIAADRNGKAVADLKQTDFEVTEDGKPQAIETFRFISVTGNEAEGQVPKAIRSDYDEESEAARDDVRLFAIFLDDYHVRRGADMVVRKALADFIQKYIGPSDMVGLMYPLQPVSAMRMSRDHDTTIEAINKFEGRKFDYRPRNEIEEKYSMYPASFVERIRTQVSLSAVESLAVHLGSLREGRKAIVLVSEGYTNVLPPQLNDPMSSMPGIGNTARGTNAGLDDRTLFQNTIDINQELRDVYNAANRNNAAIYALDPRGLTTFEFDINEGVSPTTDRKMLESSLDTLRVLAGETDGRAIVNRNDLEGGLRQVVQDSSAYYLLGYNSSQARADGKFHEIKVRIKRPGVEVRARKGYWALTAEEMKAATAPPKPSAPAAVTRALGAFEQSHRARFIRSWIGTERGENGKTKVTFVWEPLSPVPGQERNEATGLSLIASGSGDEPYFRGPVPTVGGAAFAAAGSDGAAQPANASALAGKQPGRVTFEADPGPLQLRIAVKGGPGGAETIDTDVRDYRVPDLTGPQAAIGTPAVFRTANAREFRELSANADPVPTASREFRRTERLLIRFEAYGPGGSAPEVTARVLNRTGKAMADLVVQPPAAAGKPYQLDLPLAGFAAGEYLVEVKAKGPEGEAQELVAIRVTS